MVLCKLIQRINYTVDFLPELWYYDISKEGQRIANNVAVRFFISFLLLNELMT